MRLLAWFPLMGLVCVLGASVHNLCAGLVATPDEQAALPFEETPGLRA